jgi:Asp-tRNA(Asn)/Glu-tRNA(Gln) amidotransferase A subunit family amidase
MTNDKGPLTIHAAAAAMRAGTLTPVDLLDQCLARIDRYESLVRAWVVIDRDGARRQAERLTDELMRGQVRGPLHGIPVGVKDIIDVFDLPTGCGSKLWAKSIARQDATCVQRLRAAGAVILGKTVTTAYAYLDPPVTRNPWDPTRTPGGSSSGSAAAVACGMCLAALGTQTVGSLTRPASFCGVYSFKPSKWRVDDDGVLPLSPTLDHVGFMARCVDDLAIVANAVTDDAPDFRAAVAESRDPHRSGIEFVPGEDVLERADSAMRAAFNRVTGCAPEGARWEPVALPPEFSGIPQSLRAILAVEAAQVHGERLDRHPDDYPPIIRSLIDEGRGVPATTYAEALRHHRSAGSAADRFLYYTRGVMLTPATLGVAPDRSTTGDAYFNAPWSYTGRPTISIPIEHAEGGMPLAVQLAGGGDQLPLFQAAAWLERQLGFDMRLPPTPDELASREW